MEPNIAWAAFKVMNLALEALDCYRPLGSSVVGPIMRIMAQFQPVSTNRQGLIELTSRFELIKSAIDKLGEDGLHEESRVTVDALRRELVSLMDELNDNQSTTDDVTNAHLQARLERFFNHTDSASPLRKHNMALAHIIAKAMSVPIDAVLGCLHNLQRSKLSQVAQGQVGMVDTTGGTSARIGCAIPTAPSTIMYNYYISGGSGGSGGRGGETGGSGGTGEGPRFIYKTYLGYQGR
ncbi:hypothetical protein B0H14DRAFT_1000715 [Mycena olivaceomarginata]|nr:hypothetical protein B0H14DRAFT_1000715 [Mycena olivaceomarginata]